MTFSAGGGGWMDSAAEVSSSATIIYLLERADCISASMTSLYDCRCYLIF